MNIIITITVFDLYFKYTYLLIKLNTFLLYEICISAVLSSSVIGETLINTLNSLTFLQSEHIQPVITSLISTFQSLHTLNQKMCSHGLCFKMFY